MRQAFLSLSVAALVLLSGCGGGGSATPTGTAPALTAAPAATPLAASPTGAPEATEPAATEPEATEPTATEEATPEPVETPAESEAAGASPAGLDLCSLLTTAQVGAALKETVMDGSPDTGSCTWAPGDANGTTLLIVEQDTVDDFNSIRTITGGVYEVTTVSGLGDDAYVSVATGTNVATLYVRKGDNVIQLAVADPAWAVDDVTAAEKALAAEAVAGI